MTNGTTTNGTMTYDTITVMPSTPYVGAEIGNIDLTRPLSNRQVEEVHQAILRSRRIVLPRSENQL